MAEKKRYVGPPLVWRTCPHCGARYDDGNAMAAFHHRNRECKPVPLAGEGQRP